MSSINPLELKVGGKNAPQVAPDIMQRVEDSGFYRVGPVRKIDRKEIAAALETFALTQNYNGVAAIREAMVRHVLRYSEHFNIKTSALEVQRTADAVLYATILGLTTKVKEFYSKATGFVPV